VKVKVKFNINAMESLTAFLLAVYVVFVSLNPVISQSLGWSIYPFFLLLLLFLNTALLSCVSNSKYYKATLISPANMLMVCFTAMLFFSVETMDGFKTVLGAVLLPYLLGVMYALRRSESSQLERYLFILLLIKSLLVLVFFNELIKEYPLRPEFQGSAIYLQLGWALDVVPFLVVYFMYKKHKLTAASALIVSIVLFVLAFVIVTMLSRTMIILSVLMTMIFSFIFIREIKIKLFGATVYPVFVLVCLLAFPLKQDHLFSMAKTMTNFAAVTEATDSPDKSTLIRIEGIFSTLFDKNISSEEHPLDVKSGNFYWAGHFWLGQVNYYIGKFGLFIFILLTTFFILNIYNLFKTRHYGDDFSNVILIMLSISYLLHPLYVSGILNAPIFFLLLGLVVNLNSTNAKLSICSEKLTMSRPTT